MSKRIELFSDERLESIKSEESTFVPEEFKIKLIRIECDQDILMKGNAN